MSELSSSTKFWNDIDIVDEFADRPPVQYWKDFLVEINDRSKLYALDLGCGGGRNTELLVDLGFQTFGLDLNKGMVARTKKRISDKSSGEKYCIIQGHMASLPLREESIDLIISNGVLHNANTTLELEQAFDEVARVTKKGGCVLLSMFTEDFIDKDSLPTKPEDNIYLTGEGLRMVLYPTNRLLEKLALRSLTPTRDVQQYVAELNTWKRSIVRIVLSKK